jgi:thioredoxin-related protein
MDTVTYPNQRTVDFVNRFLIAHRENLNSPSPVISGFTIQYTPTVIILDGRGTEHARIVGFLPPEEFIPPLILGVGKAWFGNERVSKAILMLDILLLEYPRSKSAAEASDLKKRWQLHAGSR